MYHGIDHRYGYRAMISAHANVLQVHTSNTELTTDLTYLILSYCTLNRDGAMYV